MSSLALHPNLSLWHYVPYHIILMEPPGFRDIWNPNLRMLSGQTMWHIRQQPYSMGSWRPSLNSSSTSAAYMRQWIGSTLVQIMGYRLDGAKPFSEAMLNYCQLDPGEHISMKFYLKLKYFHSGKCVWTCRLRNGGHCVQGEMSYSALWTSRWLEYNPANIVVCSVSRIWQFQRRGEKEQPEADTHSVIKIIWCFISLFFLNYFLFNRGYLKFNTFNTT